MSDHIEDMLKMVATVSDMPPYPRCIYASHSVPYGRVYRMWTTRGEMIVYANRGEVADVTRPVAERLGLVGLFGIPVVVG